MSDKINSYPSMGGNCDPDFSEHISAFAQAQAQTRRVSVCIHGHQHFCGHCGGVPKTPAPSALQHQEGGGHYKGLKIQPIEYIHANGVPFAEGSVIKYVTRWRSKGGVADLKKARHFLDLLIELESRPNT